MTWILLRGLARESAHWGRFAVDLALALGEPVVTVEVPGNGTRCAEPTPPRMDAIVDACREDALRRNVAPPFDLLALSLGAMVAIAWADRYPGEIERCVSINTSLRPYAPFPWRLRPSSYAALIATVLARDAVARERFVLKVTSGMVRAHADVVHEWAAIARLRPVRFVNVVRQLVAAARYRGPAVRPACDLLLLAGARDALVDVRCSRAVAHAWGVPLVEHPLAGHDLPLDDPAWVIEHVRAWLRRTRGARGEDAAVVG